MAKFASKKVSARTFSRAFDQMCNFVAVSKVGRPAETIKGLVQFCFIEQLTGRFDGSSSVADHIDTVFGIRISETQIQAVIDEMVGSGILLRPSGTNLVLASGARADLLGKIQDAKTLEEKVKVKWIEEVAEKFPDLPIDRMWGTLRVYLSSAFNRHGLQAAALLDPTIDTPEDYSKSLSALLAEALNGVFEEKDREKARLAMSDFMAEIGSNPDRARYVTQLADGAFNFYTLEVDPEVAKLLRAKLSPMLLFLDTNFLFGILGLHNNLQVEVSHELIRAVKAHKLPFELRYHEETAQEMGNTILHYGGNLRSQHWSSGISRAAAKSRYLSGIELKYHEQNAKASIDPEEFLRPYEHFDVLLKDQGIRVFRSREDRQQACTDLYADYKKYLDEKRREKPYKTVFHDATVLDAVRQQRSKATSSIEAGALLITCDYWFYQFDRESARQNRNLACVLLPNIFWQILRPFVPSGTNFEKSFAETFALPEFRVVGSGASKACSKMLSLIASYRDVPEETALKMLSNDVLLKRLLATKDDVEFKACVEEAFVQENAALIEERAALAIQLEQERKDKDEREQTHREQVEKDRRERADLENRLTQTKAEADDLRKTVAQKQDEIEIARLETKRVSDERSAKEKEAQDEEKERRRAERRAHVLSVVSAILSSAVLTIIFEWSIRSLPWTWLINHPNSIGLRVSFSTFIAALALGAFITKWRTYCWGGGAFAVFLVILQILAR